MIELPFGNGVTAALIFVIFELILLPILMESTTKAAAFLVHKHASKGNHVQVSTPSYPLWSEGLFSRQRSHALIFLIRMVCIAIPVYLETRLQFVQRPVEDAAQLPSAFVIKSKPGGFYGEKTRDFRRVFRTCSYVDENGWLIAATANVTYAGEEQELSEGQFLDTVLCVRGTAEPTFRIEQFRTHLMATHREHDRNVSFKFPARIQQTEDTLNPTFVRIPVSNAKNVECFTTNLFKDDSYWDLYCHKLNDSRVDFFYAPITVTLKDPQFVTSNSAAIIVDSKNRTLSIALPEPWAFLRFLVRVEFKTRVLVYATDLLSNSHAPNLELVAELREELGINLYSKAQNVPVRIHGDADVQHTILDDQTLIIGLIQIGFIFASGIAMKLLFLWKKIAAPDTLNDLSQNWARVIYQRRRTAANDHIKLSLISEMCENLACDVYVPTISDENCSAEVSVATEVSLANQNGERRPRWMKWLNLVKRKAMLETSDN